MKVSKPYLLAALAGLEAVKSYRPTNKTEFASNYMSQDAILMRLQDIGENLCHLRDNCPGFWELHANDDWVRAIGLRNIISHAYGEVDLGIIWILISKDLGRFQESIQKLL